MVEFTRQVAEIASFQAFINGYLREVDSGSLLSSAQWKARNPDASIILMADYVIELQLPSQRSSIVLEVAYKSIVGCHHISVVYCQRGSDTDWKRESLWSVLMMLLKEIYCGNKVAVQVPVKTHQLELTYRLSDSLQNMILYLNHHSMKQKMTGLPLSFIQTEQKMILGHWLHPTPKSRQGILEWQHSMFAPEMQGKFQLHYFAVDRALVESNSADVNDDPETICLAAAEWPLEILQANEILLPVHPLQASWLCARQELLSFFQSGQIRYLGAFGLEFSATSSVRTVYHPNFPWMLKFSIPVKITNSFRQNKKNELKAGVMMSRLYQTLEFQSLYPQFHMIRDPAYITVNVPGMYESGFEVIFRQNPFFYDEVYQETTNASAFLGKVTLAALLQDGWAVENHEQPNASNSLLKNILQELSEKENRPQWVVANEWFDRYWLCAIEPLFMLLDKWGIGLEAHQQNSVVDISSGYPSAYYYRDNQGFYLNQEMKSDLLKILPDLSRCPELFYEQEMLMDRITYYIIMNHVFALIYRLGADGFVNEGYWLVRAKEKFLLLQECLVGAGKECVRRILSDQTLPSKANLLTRVNDIDELEAELEMAVYIRVPNPFSATEKTIHRYREVAYA